MPIPLAHKIAVIDFGTNTCRLLIAEAPPPAADDNSVFKQVLNNRTYIKLFKETPNTISTFAWERAYQALANALHTCKQHQVAQVYAVATEGLRRANNSQQFLAMIEERLHIKLPQISGDIEAQLIYHGVKQIMPLGKAPQLIVDIGGGSVEFIIANKNGIQWKQSFPIGGSVLYQRFHKTEPIHPSEIAALQKHLLQELHPLLQAAAQTTQPINTLIGTSGTFSALHKVQLQQPKYQNTSPFHPTSINLNFLHTIGQQLLQANLKEREQIPGISSKRVDIIVVAYLVVAFVVKNLPINSMHYSNYAIKEGLIWSALQQSENVKHLRIL